MEYYVKPTLARAPDHLILHVATNDVRQSTPQEIHAWATDQEGTTYNESRYFRSNHKK
jgi:hypothetical protein